MKKFYFVIALMLFSKTVNAQIINFPDPNLKTALLSSSPDNAIAQTETLQPIAIDANTDGEIEVSETMNVYNLFLPIYSNISDLTGIENFQNVTSLSCTYNNLSSIDISGMPNLKYLYLGDNELNTVVLNAAIESFFCDRNQLQSVDISMCLNLETFSCTDNLLTTIDITDLNNLHQLTCWGNLLTTLNVAGSKLNSLDCHNNLLNEIDFTGISTSFTPAYFFLNCSNNLLTSLDLSVLEAGTLPVVQCDINPNLQSINAKHGQAMYDVNPTVPPGPSLSFSNCGNLEYICADEFNFDYLQQKIDTYAYTNCTIDSSCTLVTNYFTLAENVIAYPNPAQDWLKLNTSTPFESARIFNMLGQVVLSISNVVALSEIDVSNLKSGNYYLVLESPRGNAALKFIKE